MPCCCLSRHAFLRHAAANSNAIYAECLIIIAAASYDYADGRLFTIAITPLTPPLRHADYFHLMFYAMLALFDIFQIIFFISARTRLRYIR